MILLASNDVYMSMSAEIVVISSVLRALVFRGRLRFTRRGFLGRVRGTSGHFTAAFCAQHSEALFFSPTAGIATFFVGLIRMLNVSIAI